MAESIQSLPLRPTGNIVAGMSIMTVAMLMAPGMDVLAKYLGTTGNVTPGVVTFGRFLTQAVLLFLLLVVLVQLGRSKAIMPTNIAGNLLRGALMATAAFLFFTAVTYMPVADAISIFFVEPLIVTVLSGIFLGEVVGWRRRVAVLIGFVGALIVIQPSFQEVGYVTLLPLGTAFIFALYLMLTRKIASDNDDPLAMQFAAGLGGTLMMTFYIVVFGIGFGVSKLQPSIPSTEFLFFLIFTLGALGTISHLLIVIACAKAPASILAPFQYVEIVSATILGLLIFGDFPSLIKWVGITIIISSGIYIFLRERKLSKLEGVSS